MCIVILCVAKNFFGTEYSEILEYMPTAKEITTTTSTTTKAEKSRNYKNLSLRIPTKQAYLPPDQDIGRYPKQQIAYKPVTYPNHRSNEGLFTLRFVSILATM